LHTVCPPDSKTRTTMIILHHKDSRIVWPNDSLSAMTLASLWQEIATAELNASPSSPRSVFFLIWHFDKRRRLRRSHTTGATHSLLDQRWLPLKPLSRQVVQSLAYSGAVWLLVRCSSAVRNACEQYKDAPPEQSATATRMRACPVDVHFPPSKSPSGFLYAFVSDSERTAHGPVMEW
jgi:hypothetical protein